MDIIEKCELITSNSLVFNRDTAKNAKIDLEIYNEIKNEIIRELESIINPIIQDYKNYVKGCFYENYLMQQNKINHYEIEKKCNNVKDKINFYLKALCAINKKINEITSNNN
ncbi:MAG: hypothetical protein JG776_2191 [Caloramator sp.]|jgi:hypothetical protein|uniref:hypothetical protein n=1 Tax=Caloramator sp. TaxID=1871330 RepID=UPI001D1F7419|nr:hypothetical protein [Caloramator sp.]MBZ4664473.1 hypothetical protein [Caloramator sp.]